jgi:hypothetical protein
LDYQRKLRIYTRDKPGNINVEDITSSIIPIPLPSHGDINAYQPVLISTCNHAHRRYLGITRKAALSHKIAARMREISRIDQGISA